MRLLAIGGWMLDADSVCGIGPVHPKTGGGFLFDIVFNGGATVTLGDSGKDATNALRANAVNLLLPKA